MPAKFCKITVMDSKGNFGERTVKMGAVKALREKITAEGGRLMSSKPVQA